MINCKSCKKDIDEMSLKEIINNQTFLEWIAFNTAKAHDYFEYYNIDFLDEVWVTLEFERGNNGALS